MKIKLLWPVEQPDGSEIVWTVEAEFTPYEPARRWFGARDDFIPAEPEEVEIIDASRDLFGNDVTATKGELAALRADVLLEEALCEEGRRACGSRAERRRAETDHGNGLLSREARA